MDQNKLFYYRRNMALEGRINVIFEEASPNTTRVTVNTRYVVNRKINAQPAGGGLPASLSDSISFNTGSGASFQANKNGQATECVATGKLESAVLESIR